MGGYDLVTIGVIAVLLFVIGIVGMSSIKAGFVMLLVALFVIACGPPTGKP